MTPALLIFCNAFDDRTRIERGVTTDSPAGSRKVLQLARALRSAGVHPWVLSLGRGAAGGKPMFFRACVRRVDGVPVVYAPFSTVPWLSELISLCALVPMVFRLRKYRTRGALFYNRMPAYLLSLFACSVSGYRRFLDLEDGEVRRGKRLMGDLIRNTINRTYDRLCSDGALLACSALREWTSVRPIRCYYGVAIGNAASERFGGSDLTFLMGGALLPETGADLLADVIRRLRAEAPPWARKIRFEVTGQGSSLERFRELETMGGGPVVRVHGRTTDEAYRAILSRCDVGLALKLNEGELAHTTFPSKVIEYAAAGLLVLTTDISDVRKVLGDNGAVFLQQDDPDSLIDLMRTLVMDKHRAQEIAALGSRSTRAMCEPRQAGQVVSDFLFGRRQ